MSRERQLETLETIAALETEAAVLAASFPEIASARAYIRPRSAILLLTPVATSAIRPETIAAVNAFITRNTGLTKHQIVVKRLGPRPDKRVSNKGEIR